MRHPSAIIACLALVCSLGAAPAAFADNPPIATQATAAGTIASGVSVQVDGDVIGEFSTLQEALNVANDPSSTSTVTVTLEKGAAYTVDSKLRIYSNTVLDLNGATIKRSKTGINDGIIYNYPVGWKGTSGVLRSDAAAGGYNMSSNITVKNGTLDGGDTSKVAKNGAADLLRFDHASGITVSNVDFKNVYDCHHLEFVGVKDGTVSNCTFTGFKFQIGKENNAEYGREAIELDAAWTNNPSDLTDAKSMWAKDTYLDMTANQNCVVEGCTFTDLPTAVGSHHWSTSKGYKNSNNVTIRNNTITAPASRKNYKTAITAGGIDNLTVSGNTVTGPYAFSVHAYRGSTIAITGNTFDGAKKNSIMADGKAKKVSIDTNKITNAAQHAISTLDCSVKSISNNTISNPKANGITVSSGSVAVIKGNKLTNVYKNAISVVGGTVGTKGKAATGILNNTVKKTKTGNAVSVSGSSTVVNINNNKLTEPKKSGVSITGKAKVTSIKSNTITKKSGKFGIYLGNKLVKTAIQNNKITVELAKYGIGTISGAAPKMSGNTITVK